MNKELELIENQIEEIRPEYLKAFYPLLADGNQAAFEIVYSVASGMLEKHKNLFHKNIDLTLSELEKALELKRIDFVTCLLYPIGQLYTLTGVSHYRKRFDAIMRDFEREPNRQTLKERWDKLHHERRQIISNNE